MPDVSILSPSVATSPKQYTVTGTQDIVLRTVAASYDGTGAAGSFVPALQIVDNTGVVVATFPITNTLAAGASADVTWFPSVGGSGGSSPSTSNTLFLTAAGMWPSITNGSTFPNRVESVTNLQDVYLIDFVQSVQGFAQATVVMPANWNAGTVTAVFYWLVNGTTAGSVTWQIQGRAYGTGVTLDQAFGAAQTVSSAATGTANQVIISSATSAVTLAGTPAASQLVQFRIARNGNTDAFAATARLLGVQVTYGTS